MVDFGDEFVIDSYRVSWLIWVQLLVMVLLLLVLFFGFSIFALDNYKKNDTSNSASSSSQSNAKENKTSPSHGSQVEESQSIQREIETSKSEGIDGEEIQERDESSAKDITLFRLLGQGDHPCHYIGLAKQAILKCFGLGNIVQSSRNRKHSKED